MNREQIHIANPCTEDFDSMEGEGFRRFCDKCEKHVHDLSDLTPTEARALLDQNKKSELCVVYRFDSSGKIKFREKSYPRAPRGQLLGIKKLIAAAAFIPVLAALPACNPAFDDPAVVEQPCEVSRSASNDTFTPIDAIMEAERRLLQELKDLLGFEPEIEMVAGEMMVIEEENIYPDPPILIETNPVVPEPEQIIMGDWGGEMELEPEPEPAPFIEPTEIRMGKIAIEDVH